MEFIVANVRSAVIIDCIEFNDRFRYSDSYVFAIAIPITIAIAIDIAIAIALESFVAFPD